ncbi:type II toxin-antitoxin system HicB family antitoxin [Variovorax sp. CAN2819]|uniref:type II toxin-antitoxin system HicB family antitoxin n=1 Tax=Variovorax sp. CAN15 TaxID=3046727 RepID=UPI00264A2AFC|nr:type II toxin-antitoxin system HicB family antitoxin [Variovorax sp. CAN15]MDN6885267.1 type II toxin-antitoxin system HicB family antitoxin [Variovorax sp. CAN15]
MRYQVDVRKDGDGYMASFPDIPEALTAGATREEALEMARDALISALDFYFEDKREVPSPSRIAKGKDAIELPASLCAKVLLLNEMIRQKIRPSDLARKLHTSAQEVNRLTDLRHTTKVDAVQQALQALGKRLEFAIA